MKKRSSHRRENKSFGIFKTIHLNSSYLQLLGMRKLQSFETLHKQLLLLCRSKCLFSPQLSTKRCTLMNCYCGMVDRRRAFNLISTRDHCQRSSPSQISDTPRAGFEPAQNLSSDFVE